MITQERLKEILHYNPETGIFTWKVKRKVRIGDRAGFLHHTGYRNIKIDGKRYPEHRIAIFYVTGEWPEYDVHHINEIKNDNRFCNLKNATRSQNIHCQGKKSNNSSGFRGVRFVRNKWRSKIRIEGKDIHLGCFNSAEEAHAAYFAASIKYFGEFAHV